MKKTTLLIFSLIFCLLADGQIFKVQGGPTFSSMNWKNDSHSFGSAFTGNYTGYSFFLGLDYSERNNFNLSSNAGFIRKGGSEVLPKTDIDGNVLGEAKLQVITDYLSLNTMVDVNFPVGNTVWPYMSVGPRLDFLVGYNEQIQVVDEAGELNSMVFGLITEAGLKVNLDVVQLGIRANYYLDFTKIAKWDNGLSQGDISANVFTLNFSLGYRL